MLFSDFPDTALKSQYLKKEKQKEMVNLFIGLQRGGSSELSGVDFRNKWDYSPLHHSPFSPQYSSNAETFRDHINQIPR